MLPCCRRLQCLCYQPSAVFALVIIITSFCCGKTSPQVQGSGCPSWVGIRALSQPGLPPGGSAHLRPTRVALSTLDTMASALAVQAAFLPVVAAQQRPQGARLPAAARPGARVRQGPACERCSPPSVAACAHKRSTSPCRGLSRRMWWLPSARPCPRALAPVSPLRWLCHACLCLDCGGAASASSRGLLATALSLGKHPLAPPRSSHRRLRPHARADHQGDCARPGGGFPGQHRGHPGRCLSELRLAPSAAVLLLADNAATSAWLLSTLGEIHADHAAVNTPTWPPALPSAQAELDNGASVAALRRFNDNLRSLPADSWGGRRGGRADAQRLGAPCMPGLF